MEYTHLTDAQQAQLLAERITGLEADHYRTALLLAELGPEADAKERESMSNDLVELERRITVHRGGKVAEPVAEPAASTADGAAEKIVPALNGRVPA